MQSTTVNDKKETVSVRLYLETKDKLEIMAETYEFKPTLVELIAKIVNQAYDNFLKQKGTAA